MAPSTRSLALGLVVLAAAGPAWAAWSEPFAIAGNGGQPALAMSRGVPEHAVLAWTGSDGTSARIRVRSIVGGELGAVQTLSGAGQDAVAPEVGVDAGGNAVVTWLRFDGETWRAQARARSAGGALDAVQTLSPPGEDASDARVAVGPDGRAVFVWQVGSGIEARIQTRARSAAGDLGPVQTLAGRGRRYHSPGVAVDDAGNAVFVWKRADAGTGLWVVETRARAADGSLGPLQRLSSASRDAYTPQVAVDAAGTAVFVWQVALDLEGRIQARTRAADGTLGPLLMLTPADQYAHSPRVALDAAGNAVFVWIRSHFPSHRVHTRLRTADGTLTGTQALSSAWAKSARVAVDAAGNAVFAWIDGDDQVRTRTRSAAGALGTLATVSAAGVVADAPALAVDAGGAAVLTYEDTGPGAVVGHAGP